MITINPEKLVRNVSKNGDFIFRGGLSLQEELGRQNVERFQKFLSTPQGRLFTATQVGLQALNPKRGTRIYNPVAPIISKALPQEFTLFKPRRHFDTTNRFRKTKNQDAVRLFDRKGKIGGSLQVRYGGEVGNLQSFPNRKKSKGESAPKDFIKFRIRDAVNGKYIIFPALLGSISDNSSAETTSYNYIGRADKVHIYQGYTRSVGFSVDIVALSKKDIPIIWEKVNYAKGLVLPQYKEFFTEGGGVDTTRPVAPIVYLTLGDLFNDAPGFFSSVNLTIAEGSTWELSDGQQVPHVCQLTFEFTYIGKQTPTMTSAQYDNIGKKFLLGDPNKADQVTKFNKSQEDERKKVEKRQAERIASNIESQGGLENPNLQVNLNITGNTQTGNTQDNLRLNVVPNSLG